MTSPGCTLVGTLTDASGNTMAGIVTMTLCGFGAGPALISGSNVFAQTQIQVTAATNGTFSIPFFGNHQISPSDTYYQISVTPPGSNPSLFNSSTVSNQYQFLTDGTFDWSTISPFTGPYPTNPVISPNYLVFSYEEVPTGTINGTNATFHLENTPAPISSLNLYVNGIRQTRGIAYTITGNVITYASGYIPLTGNTHICSYTYNS